MKYITIILLASLTFVSLWASSTEGFKGEQAANDQVEPVLEGEREVKVEPGDEILALFESFGIDSACLLDGNCSDDGSVDWDVRNELADIIGENREDVVDLIQEELTANLHEGGAVMTHMTLGSFYFTARFDSSRI